MIREISFIKPERIGSEFLNGEKELSEAVKLERIVLPINPYKADVLINNILEQIEKIESNNFKADKIVLSLDNYDRLTAELCNRLGIIEKPKTFQGIKLVVVPEPHDYCKVVAGIEDEFLFREYIRKDKAIRSAEKMAKEYPSGFSWRPERPKGMFPEFKGKSASQIINDEVPIGIPVTTVGYGGGLYEKLFKESEKTMISDGRVYAGGRSDSSDMWSMYDAIVIDKEKLRIVIDERVIAKNAEHAKGKAGVLDRLAEKDFDNTKFAIKVAKIMDVKPVDDGKDDD